MRTVDSLRTLLARLVVLASVVVAVILVVYVILVVFKATPSNGLVRFFHDVAKPLSWQFNDLFSPKKPRTKIAVNYIVAALVYLVAGRIVARIVTIGAGSARKD